METHADIFEIGFLGGPMPKKGGIVKGRERLDLPGAECGAQERGAALRTDLFEIHPVSHKLWVACKSLSEGDEAEHDCEVACTGCARCVVDAPEGLIEIKDNLAVIDYSKNDLASKVAIERCPTGAIVWMEDRKTIKGSGAKKILRMEPLPRG